MRAVVSLSKELVSVRVSRARLLWRLPDIASPVASLRAAHMSSNPSGLMIIQIFW